MVGRICGIFIYVLTSFKSGMEEKGSDGWCMVVTDDERG